MPDLVMTPIRTTPPELPSWYIACKTAASANININNNLLDIKSAALTLLDKFDALVTLHILTVELAHKAVHVRTARAANRTALAHAHTAQRNRVHLAATLLVPTGHDDASHQRVAVVVAIVLEFAGRLLDARLLTGLVSVQFTNNREILLGIDGDL